MTDLATFEPWPKTPRLRRDIIVTEKIDGTNGQLAIRALHGHEIDDAAQNPEDAIVVDADGDCFALRAGSRNRWLSPTKNGDNAGFAAWAHEHADILVSALGEGRHYGEWWGQGIQRGYGATGRSFHLFNAARWRKLNKVNPLMSDVVDPVYDAWMAHGVEIGVVPVLYAGPWSDERIDEALRYLRRFGSLMASHPAEGVIVYHTATRSSFKVLLENDHVAKGEVA